MIPGTAGNGWPCQACGMWVYGGVHTCAPAKLPQHDYGRYYFMPNVPTLEEIRKVVREEIERAQLGKTEGGK